MASLKDTLQDYGLSTTLTVRTTGQQLTVAFMKGQTSIPVGLSVGPHALDGHLRLVTVDAPDGDPNLKLVLDIPVREVKSDSTQKPGPVGEGKTVVSEVSVPTAPSSTPTPADTTGAATGGDKTTSTSGKPSPKK
jgi:hypothetical protein